jgi:hypothetical protein
MNSPKIELPLAIVGELALDPEELMAIVDYEVVRPFQPRTIQPECRLPSSRSSSVVR